MPDDLSIEAVTEPGVDMIVLLSNAPLDAPLA
jgi:hypothetical protein